jgi:tartrate-resistant acid phosphatase type 5
MRGIKKYSIGLVFSLCMAFSGAAFSQSFAVIGDYGVDNENELAVSNLIKSWNPEFIITVGDNIYLTTHDAEHLDRVVGKYFASFIHPYRGAYGPGASENRFFPSLGNHDLDFDDGRAYLDYFELPNNERYYDFVKGSVHFFVINSSSREPDGCTDTSAQGQWLKDRMSRSTAAWKIVYFHKPPFSSDTIYGGFPEMRWPFKEYGATLVLSGHAHIYERLYENGVYYFVNGLGGAGIYQLRKSPAPQTQFRYNEKHGAMKVMANPDSINLQFITADNFVIDNITLRKTTVGIDDPSSGGFRVLSIDGEGSTGITAQVELPRSGSLQCTLHDYTGRMVYENTFKGDPKNSEYRLPCTLIPGAYIATFVFGEEKISRKMVITR